MTQILGPVVRDDAFRIAGEAVRNAYRHARPKRIEVYSARALSVRVRDDGKGIEKTLARGGAMGISDYKACESAQNSPVAS